jgi:hypothetical protein
VQCGHLSPSQEDFDKTAKMPTNVIKPIKLGMPTVTRALLGEIFVQINQAIRPITIADIKAIKHRTTNSVVKTQKKMK